MDEGTLNDLLECSVCLDRLDTSSKVLPCQHTFCRKCLQEIVHKHKELRCPECRILVNSKVDDLPPNVLLMRILEGMKNNAVPKKQQRAPKSIQAPAVHHTPVHQQQKINNNKTSPQLVPHQPYAKALYDYEPKEVGDLSFKRGDVILLRKRIDAHWYQGECGGKQGLFPLSYVQIITPLPSHIPQCKALYDFQTDKHEEEGCLTFKEGDIINVIRRVDENWAEGKLDGRIGIFPLTFVELNSLARSLMKLSTNAQPGPSRVAPPTPTTEDSTPLIPTDHSRTIVPQQTQNQQLFVQQTPVHQGLATSDSSSTVSSGSSSTTTPNVSSSNTSSNSSTAPSSPASPPPRTQPPLARTLVHAPQRSPNTAPSHQHNKEKRHSFTSLTPATYNKNTHRHSAEIVAAETASPSSHSHKKPEDEIKLPAPYVALYPYKPQKADELELRKGGIYMVTERCQDGWYKGTSNRTQKCGVFPGNYVAHMSKASLSSSDAKVAVSFTRSGKSVSSPRQTYNTLPPELPPRSVSPATATNTISSSWHGQQDNAAVPLGRSSSAVMSSVNTTHLSLGSATVAKPADKCKDRKEKGTVGLMRRLTSIKRSKSPPPSSYSMDNPVFEDSVSVATAHPVHVRSGSCPSQLLQIQPVEHHRLFGSTSQRLKHKERPSVLTHNLRAENPAGSSSSSPDIHHHRKSNSLDAGNRTKTGVQTVHELFRCEIPYPPNSEYELELQKDDLIYVHKKREDGWYKGTLQRTGRTGLFPASFVKPA
ncbi:E3 ubiquitin-protein ligase SH3RF1 isoform X2 [Tribolium castaneum]|uniref:RING-type E3 ubiquitin transferase n=1 Tax=Tribolium castaneum TaxID=7070 RepID=D2A024_TRICA|nr:PREDICTED: E3 ubiquitin-protein ligase SH3RF1 isoform X2 [Tribolium castaneum]EFA02827.2 plenty of SH3s [Tribolium castaneum]|eukprot:XP_008192211.1 PREDICTED: E3 ubiquitin-protein ligase SH3RF1 isoform X2 [Tribolium castaneum]